MGKLYLHFTIRLKDFLTHGEPNGPLFDRWLPDGQKDAVALNTGDSHATLTVWFARMGYMRIPTHPDRLFRSILIAHSV